jgi:hypothetical protein
MLSLDALFSVASAVAAAGWLALALVPLRFSFPRKVAVIVALGIATLYTALIGIYWAQGQGGFGSLDDVSRLFDPRGLLLAGWVHYLAFDLLIGTWEREEARRTGISRVVLVPSLLLTFLFGPFGWLVFLAARQFRRDVAAASSFA